MGQCSVGRTRDTMQWGERRALRPYAVMIRSKEAIDVAKMNVNACYIARLGIE